MNGPQTGRNQWIDRRGYAIATAAVAIFIVYGSLVPLAFRSITFAQALEQFEAALTSPLTIDSHADFATNILLAIPLGYLMLAAFVTDRYRGAQRYAMAALAMACCLGVSIVAEFAQVFSQSRTDSLSDIVAQTIGAFAGLTTFLSIGDRVTGWLRDVMNGREQTELLQRILLVYCVVFAIVQILPLDLTISLPQLARKYRRGMILIMPFARQYPSSFDMWWDYVATIAQSVPLGAAAVLLWSKGRSRRSPVLAFLIALMGMMLVVFAQVFVASQYADSTDVVMGACGAALGIAAATALSRREVSPSVQRSTNAAGWLVSVGVIAWIAVLMFYHWNPFNFTTAVPTVTEGIHQFLSLPFYSYYRGTDYHAFTEILRKAMLAVPLGALLRLSWSRDGSPLTARARFVTAAAFGFAVLLAIEIGQIFLPTRVPDITDAIVGETGLLTAMWLTDRVIASRSAQHRGFDVAPVSIHSAGSMLAEERFGVPTSGGRTDRWTLASVGLVAAVVAITLGIKTVLALPGIPYNAASLFLDHGGLVAVAIFSLALLWIGAGPLLLARWLGRSRYPYLIFPIGMVILAMVSRTLLKYSVTYESLDDILGTNNLFSLVTTANIWGEFWKHAFLATNADDLVSYFERRVRYVALYSPLATCLTLALMAIGHRWNSRWRLASTASIWFAIVVCAWLALCKLVIFDWAATDNLTELVAANGLLGLGGVPWLLLIAALLAADVALVVRAAERWRSVPVALLFSVAAVPVGWALLHLGLEPHLVKYGQEFSAVQFMLGPDRQHTLTTAALFMRWAVLQASGVAVMSSGAWIALSWTASNKQTSSSAATQPGGEAPSPLAPSRSIDIPTSG